MSDPSVRRWKVLRGRAPGDISLDHKAVNRQFQIRVPLDLFEDCYNDCKDREVAFAISAIDAPGYMADYIRASMALLHTLLEGATRDRVISFLSLPDKNQRSVLAHLVFRYAALPIPPGEEEGGHHRVLVPEHEGVDPNLHATMYRDQEEVEHDPAEAPLTERNPWDNF